MLASSSSIPANGTENRLLISGMQQNLPITAQEHEMTISKTTGEKLLSNLHNCTQISNCAQTKLQMLPNHTNVRPYCIPNIYKIYSLTLNLTHP